jgi:hypothetical protein
MALRALHRLALGEEIEGDAVSYDRLREIVVALAAGLIDLGLERGRRSRSSARRERSGRSSISR